MATEISWTDETWNFLAGCSKVSAGCQNCYAINMAHRLPAMANALEAKGKNPGRLKHYKGLTQKTAHGVEWSGTVTFIPEALQQPLKWKNPRKIFVNSMADCFHEDVPFGWLEQALAVISSTPQHTYQLLTKRPQRMLEFFAQIEGYKPLPNLWLGVTVEDQKAANERIPLLLKAPAAVRFLSCEPLLGVIEIAKWLDGGIPWVICGGESGPSARLCNVDWIYSLVKQCKANGVACWVKQMGSNAYSPSNPMWDNGITGKGSNPSEWPDELQVQEFPEEKTPCSKQSP